jgi:hypothetical protein
VNPTLRNLIRDLTTRPPDDVQPVNKLASGRGLPLPNDYVEYMTHSDGGEGDVGDGYIEIWPVARVLAAAETEPPVYEDFIAFAGDGANTVYGFDVAAGGEIVEGDWIGLERDALIPRGRTFTEFLQSIASG